MMHDPRLEYYRAEGEQALWRSVVLKALMDATMPGFAGESQERFFARTEADAWIRAASRDFMEVCCLAGLDGDMVRSKYVAGAFNRAEIRMDRADFADPEVRRRKQSRKKVPVQLEFLLDP